MAHNDITYILVSNFIPLISTVISYTLDLITSIAIVKRKCDFNLSLLNGMLVKLLGKFLLLLGSEEKASVFCYFFYTILFMIRFIVIIIIIISSSVPPSHCLHHEDSTVELQALTYIQQQQCYRWVCRWIVLWSRTKRNLLFVHQCPCVLFVFV